LLPDEQMRTAGLVQGLGVRGAHLPQDSPLEAEDLWEFIDLKATEGRNVEHGVVNLGPAEILENAAGQEWTFFVELTVSATAGPSGRGGIASRLFVGHCVL